MIKSILLFDPGHHRGTRSKPTWHLHPQIQWEITRLPSKASAFYIVVALGLLWSVLGAALAVAAVSHEAASLRVAYFLFAAACFTVAAFTTHGLGGHLRHYRTQKIGKDATELPPTKRHHHSKTANEGPQDVAYTSARHRATSSELPPKLDDLLPSVGNKQQKQQPSHPSLSHHLTHVSEWSFWQPFRGGPLFVATQAAGWCLFSSALTLVLYGVGATALGLAHSLHAWAIATGFAGVAAELSIAASLLTYNHASPTAALTKTYMLLSEPGFKKKAMIDIRTSLNTLAITTILYLQVHAVVAAAAATFVLMPPIATAMLWAGGLVIYFSLTGVGSAEHTGRREWPAFRDWVGRETQRVLPLLIGGFQVIKTDGAEFSDNKKYVFGYAPHGLFPIGAAYLPCTPAFQKIVGPGVRPATLTASIVFQLPFLRDLLLWIGTRAVSRATFASTLRERGAVMMVPGGQAELVEAHQAAQRAAPRVVVTTRHKGFIRIALQERACIVPVAVFGEVTSLRNAIVMPALQRLTYKLFGFPIPFLMAGRGGILPLPSKTGVKFVIGRPIEPPDDCSSGSGDGDVNAVVDRLHAEFYEELGRLWEENRDEFKGYEKMPMVFAS